MSDAIDDLIENGIYGLDEAEHKAELRAELSALRAGAGERAAQIAAHRACIAQEHDPANGKCHGDCVVCGVPWPCAYAGPPPPAWSEIAREESGAGGEHG